ncbi:YbfB/YjiJ family MFS transporter [Roseovarius sp. C7]|uniref:YbfB/YjiJ family MFS transporter n=1 Tax=Roseovarius sp. C7 TaxID=3398643 RepID=UPI0039F65558
MTAQRDWLIVFGLALGVCISNAFARFAYGLILPAMQNDLGWNYTQAGWINTANALGYIAGALLTFASIGRIKAPTLFIAGLLVTSLSLLAIGFGSGFWYLTFWRIMAGVAGAPVFIAGGAMASSLFPDDPRKNALAIAAYFGGGGLGMLLSGAVLPGLFDVRGPTVWPLAWLGLGIASFVMTPLSIWAARQIAVPRKSAAADGSLPVRRMAFALSGYGLFATGYIVYVTFIVAWMRALDMSAAMVSLCWVLIGAGIISSPFVWKPVLARFASGVPLALACVVTGLATLGPVLLPNIAGLLLSAICFGLAVFIGPGAVTSFGRKNLPQAQWGKSVSLFTLIFAIGQTIGPVAAGAVGDLTGTLSAGLLCAGLILLLAAMLAALQQPLGQENASR